MSLRENFTHVPCRHCERPFRLPLCRVKLKPFCSVECWKASVVARLEKRRRNCVVCGISFLARPWLTKQGMGLTCSRRCRDRRLIGRKQSPEEIAKRIASWKANPNKKILRGAANGNYKGGYLVCYERRLADGRIRYNVKKYRAANPHKVREWEQNRHGLKTGRLPKGTVTRLFILQRERCAACKKKLNTYHVDHIFPLSKGGKHVKSNIQLLCPSCNTRKSAKEPERFMREMGFLL